MRYPAWMEQTSMTIDSPTTETTKKSGTNEVLCMHSVAMRTLGGKKQSMITNTVSVWGVAASMKRLTKKTQGKYMCQ